MPSYRIYQLDRGGRILSGSYADCSTDADAYALAESMLGVTDQAEIWLGTRRVGQIAPPLVAPGPQPTVQPGVDALGWRGL